MIIHFVDYSNILNIHIGFSLAFGVFQEYYGRHKELLEGDSSNFAVIGTTMTVRPRLAKNYLFISGITNE